MEEQAAGDREFLQEELEAAFAGPAPLANRFIVTLSPTNVRIGFIEEETSLHAFHHRSGVCLSIDNARALARLIDTMLGEADGSKSGER